MHSILFSFFLSVFFFFFFSWLHHCISFGRFR
jgi:hypothetical protein